MSQMQFRYWDLARKGRSQSEIARDFSISRQAVNRSIKLQEREVMVLLLDRAQDSGVLVEFYDERLGVLAGITPQLGNRLVLMLVDDTGRVRVFYDQEGNHDEAARRQVLADMARTVRSSMGLEADPELPMIEIVRAIRMVKGR